MKDGFEELRHDLSAAIRLRLDALRKLEAKLDNHYDEKLCHDAYAIKLVAEGVEALTRSLVAIRPKKTSA